MLEATICMTISQMMVATPTAPADAPAFVHGETDDKPRPVPSASRVTDSAAATNAPPMTAAQETAEERDSFATETKPASGVRLTDEATMVSMAIPYNLAWT